METRPCFIWTVQALRRTHGFLVTTIWSDCRVLSCFSKALGELSLKGDLLECFYPCLRSWGPLCIRCILSLTFLPLMWKTQWNDKVGVPLVLRECIVCVALLCPFEPEVVKNCVDGWEEGRKKMVFPADFTIFPSHVYRGTPTPKSVRNLVKMHMIKSPNLEWLKKSKGWQIALESSIPLFCALSFLVFFFILCVHT